MHFLSRTYNRLKSSARMNLRSFQQIVLLGLIGCLFFYMHGVTFHLTPWSQVMFNAGVKHLYDKSRQGETTVLLFREKDIETLGVYYPVPWSTHAEVLSALATYSPRTVVIDFSFVDRRPEDEKSALAESLCNLKEHGINVLMATPYLDKPNYGVAEALLKCVTPVSPKIDPEEGVSGILTYPKAERSEKGRTLPTAAFSAYEKYRAQQTDPQAPFEASDMEVMWPSGFAPLNGKWMDCARPDLAHTVLKMISVDPLSIKRRCPYTRTIVVESLLNSTGDPDIEDAFKGRTVFYGGGFDFSGDLIASPVYEKLPGVYMHAMAFDNLVTYGEHYKRADREGALSKLMDLGMFFVASIILVLFPRKEQAAVPLCWFKRRSGEAGESADRKKEMTRFQEKVLKLAYFLPISALILFVVIWKFEIEEFILAMVLLYVGFRTCILNDKAFLVFCLVVFCSAFLTFKVMDLGPRNLLLFIVFAEVVRHFQVHMKEWSHEHLEFMQKWREQKSLLVKMVMWLLCVMLTVFSDSEQHKQGVSNE